MSEKYIKLWRVEQSPRHSVNARSKPDWPVVNLAVLLIKIPLTFSKHTVVETQSPRQIYSCNLVVFMKDNVVSV